jgi:hypothetical protein
VAILGRTRRAAPLATSTSEVDSIEEPEPSSIAMPGAASAPPAPAAIPATAETDALPSEDDLLHELARLNATNKPRALALALAADNSYPSAGIHAEARRAMIITLLVDVGRMDEARQRVKRYLEDYPDSPYVPLIEGKTGIHPRPQGPTR